MLRDRVGSSRAGMDGSGEGAVEVMMLNNEEQMRLIKQVMRALLFFLNFCGH
jgi:hypothetical protein